MGIMVYSLLSVMQVLYHPPYYCKDSWKVWEVSKPLNPKPLKFRGLGFRA